MGIAVNAVNEVGEVIKQPCRRVSCFDGYSGTARGGALGGSQTWRCWAAWRAKLNQDLEQA
jgi:hypothetical protein